jgi:hypothetical protein
VSECTTISEWWCNKNSKHTHFTLFHPNKEEEEEAGNYSSTVGARQTKKTSFLPEKGRVARQNFVSFIIYTINDVMGLGALTQKRRRFPNLRYHQSNPKSPKKQTY